VLTRADTCRTLAAPRQATESTGLNLDALNSSVAVAENFPASWVSQLAAWKVGSAGGNCCATLGLYVKVVPLLICPRFSSMLCQECPVWGSVRGYGHAVPSTRLLARLPEGCQLASSSHASLPEAAAQSSSQQNGTWSSLMISTHWMRACVGSASRKAQ